MDLCPRPFCGVTAQLLQTLIQEIKKWLSLGYFVFVIIFYVNVPAFTNLTENKKKISCIVHLYFWFLFSPVKLEKTDYFDKIKKLTKSLTCFVTMSLSIKHVACTVKVNSP